MKKVIFITTVMILGMSNLHANAKTEFMENLVKMIKGEADNVVKQIPKVSKSMKQTLSKNFDVPKLRTKIKENPQKVLLANKADEIVSKGDFEKKFFANQNYDNQLAMIVQSSKYGDEYFDVAKKVSNITPNVLNKSPYLHHIPKSQLTEITLQTKFIETLHKTGKYGWQTIKGIGKFIVENPKLSGTAGLYAWYVSDHEAFNQQLQESGKNLAAFLIDTMKQMTIGAGAEIGERADKAMENIKQDIENMVNDKIDIAKSYTFNILFGFLFFGGLFLIWRKREVVKEFITRTDKVEKKDKWQDEVDEY